MKKIIQLNSAAETTHLGEQLADKLQPGDLLLLDGDLGAGKTTFTKGLAVGLGIKRPVKSPTFTIVREYQTGRMPLYHMDVYRLENGGGDELGLEEYINGDGVVVIEWSQFVQEELPDNYLKLSFRRDDTQGENYRQLIIEPFGKHYENLIDQLIEDK